MSRMDYYRIGMIVRPHGVHGEMKLIPLTDDVNRFRRLHSAYLEDGSAHMAVDVRSVAVQPDAVFLGLSGVNTREEAEKLRGKYICVDRAHAVQLPPDTYFIADLIGCETFDSQGTAYGKITDVLQTGANDVYVIRGAKETLVPALKKVLKEVDIENKRITFWRDVLKEVAVFED